MTSHRVAALVLAAGQSRRMGCPKMVLPWRQTTVIGQVVSILEQAGVVDIVVVTGGARQEVEAALQGTSARTVYNPDYANGEMLTSIQVGLASMEATTQAAMVTLGDQPQIERRVVESVLSTYDTTGSFLVVPSYQMRRGHPWIMDRALWPAVLALHPPITLRDFLQDNSNQIHYLPVETSSILQDLDTPEDYQKYQPE